MRYLREETVQKRRPATYFLHRSQLYMLSPAKRGKEDVSRSPRRGHPWQSVTSVLLPSTWELAQRLAQRVSGKAPTLGSHSSFSRFHLVHTAILPLPITRPCHLEQPCRGKEETAPPPRSAFRKADRAVLFKGLSLGGGQS